MRMLKPSAILMENHLKVVIEGLSQIHNQCYQYDAGIVYQAGHDLHELWLATCVQHKEDI